MRPLASLCLALCLFPLTASTQTQPNPPAYKSNPKYVAAITEAKKLYAQRMFIFALDSYKKASKIAEGQDAQCLDDIFNLQLNLEKYKDALATAAQLEAVATFPAAKATAQIDRAAPTTCRPAKRANPTSSRQPTRPSKPPLPAIPRVPPLTTSTA